MCHVQVKSTKLIVETLPWYVKLSFRPVMYWFSSFLQRNLKKRQHRIVSQSAAKWLLFCHACWSSHWLLASKDSHLVFVDWRFSGEHSWNWLQASRQAAVQVLAVVFCFQLIRLYNAHVCDFFTWSSVLVAWRNLFRHLETFQIAFTLSVEYSNPETCKGWYNTLSQLYKMA